METVERLEAERVSPAVALPLAASARALMVALGFLPVLHLLLTVAAGVWASGRVASIVGVLLALYVAPPLVVRLLSIVAPLPAGMVAPGSRGFFAWWASSQCQTIFNRVPLLEEGLRMVPGLYSQWLRLWGARVGALVYWAPGLRIADRSLLAVGDRVVFGAGVRLHGHLLTRDAAGAMSLIVAPVRIGSEALVGAYSLLAPGVGIAAGESSPAARTLGPFTEWRDGRRHSGSTR
jgi:hypothetical protein